MPPKKAGKPAPPSSAARASRVVVPDTSVLVDGRVTMLIQRGDLKGARIVIALPVLSELEYAANLGRESGFNGLDEIVKLQELRDAAKLELEFVGERPLPEEIELAKSGEIDAMIRDVALDEEATLLTSDRVQAHVARAMGLPVEYVRPISDESELAADLSGLGIMKYFTPDTMSVHLKYKVPPMAKRGTPGDMKLVTLSEKPLELRELTSMRRELIEAARRDADSFVEIERHGATVVQLQNMRIAIAQPPFSDGIEITAVRPVSKLTLDEYEMPDELKQRLRNYQRGTFVSGPPGSGKSTFVTAIAEWLNDAGAIVKTMESPRDLQVSDAITQYAPLDKDMQFTSDVLLLVRPDFVVYDEVRRTDDFKVFGDMRLAGVGLIGVTHANRAIDAVQRLIGRVELGMIPQVVDTVIHIEKGRVKQVLELSFTVKVPYGMQEADLARPVIEVRDFRSKRVEFEIYTYGEQVVVMPVASRAGPGGAGPSAKDRLAATQLKHTLRNEFDGRFEIEWGGESSITLYAEEWEIPKIIGRGGSGVQRLEMELGLKIDVRPLAKRPPRGDRGEPGKTRQLSRRSEEEDFGGEESDEDEEEDDVEATEEPRSSPREPREKRYATVTPELRKSKKNLVLILPRDLAGQDVEVVVDDEILLRTTAGRKGDVRVSRGTDAGHAILDALARGRVVNVRV